MRHLLEGDPDPFQSRGGQPRLFTIDCQRTAETPIRSLNLSPNRSKGGPRQHIATMRTLVAQNAVVQQRVSVAVVQT